jgi:hypothetical protein
VGLPLVVLPRCSEESLQGRLQGGLIVETVLMLLYAKESLVSKRIQNEARSELTR